MLLLLLEQIENLTFCIFLSSLSFFIHNPHVIIFNFTKSDRNSAYCCQVTWFPFTSYDALIFFLVCPFVVAAQWLTRVWLFPTPWTAACQASLPFTNSRSLLKLMSIESVMPSNHLILCHPLLLLPSVFPASGSFPMSQLFSTHGQSIGTSASGLLVNIQDWSPLRLTGLISL